MRRLIQHAVAVLRSPQQWFAPKREASPTREMELHAAARRERQRRENRLHRP